MVMGLMQMILAISLEAGLCWAAAEDAAIDGASRRDA